MFLFCLRSGPAVCFEPWIVLFSPQQITDIDTSKASIRSTFLIINSIYLKTFSLSSDRFSRHPLAILTIVSYRWTFESLKKEKKISLTTFIWQSIVQVCRFCFSVFKMLLFCQSLPMLWSTINFDDKISIKHASRWWPIVAHLLIESNSLMLQGKEIFL